MAQSRTLCIGMDVQKKTIAVASVAQAHRAEETSLDPIGTRPCDIDHLVRTMHARATHLGFVYAAGPWGSWRSRSLSKTGSDCWRVSPSLMPKKAGERVTTDRRDAVQLARLSRSGDLPPVYGPRVAGAAMRDRSQARAATIRARKAAQIRLQAFCLRHAIRSTGQANWSPAPLRWRSAVVCPPPTQQSVFQAYVRAVNEHPERLQRLEPALHEHGTVWRLPRAADTCHCASKNDRR